MKHFSGWQVRKIILDQSLRAKTGHIGSCLSIADILAVLYSRILNIPDGQDPTRDRFILSKGHAALALYAALYLKGILPQEMLDTFHEDGSALGTHPDQSVPGIDFSSGSLGQGLSFAVGAALGATLKKQPYTVYALVSDAECNEGSVWEAALFAAQHKLSNLVVFVDVNGQQAFGYTKDVLDLSPMAEKWRSFGWDTIVLDGHNEELLTSSLQKLNKKEGPPHVIVASTTFGKGVSFMESKIKWHYSPLSEPEYKQAAAEIEKFL